MIVREKRVNPGEIHIQARTGGRTPDFCRGIHAELDQREHLNRNLRFRLDSCPSMGINVFILRWLRNPKVPNCESGNTKFMTNTVQ